MARPIFASGPSSNRVLNYQLRLTDSSGIPVADGTKNVKLTFYSAAVAGTQLYTVCSADGTPTGTPTAVVASFTNGTSSVLAGDTAGLTCASGSAVAIPVNLFSNTAIYLGITVNADAEMAPRKRIVSQGYALNADLLDDLDTSSVGGSVAFIPATDGSGNLTLTKNLSVDSPTFTVDSTNRRVGVGTASPAQLLDVRGHAVMGNQSAAIFWGTDINTLLLNEQSADTASSHTNLQSDIEWNPGAASAAFTSYVSGKYSASTTSANAFSLTNGFVEGIIASAHHDGTGTLGNLIGAEALATNTTTGTVASATGIFGNASNVSGGAITNAYGGRFRASNFGGTTTNAYMLQARNGALAAGSVTSKAGVDIEDMTGAANNTDLLIGTATIPTGNYSLYNASSYNSYFAGNVGIGISTPPERLTVADGGNIFAEGGYISSPFGGYGRYENHLARSEQFDNLIWTATGVVVTPDTTAAPNGDMTADTIGAGALATDNLRQPALSAPVTASTTWTGSVWLRVAAGSATVNLAINSGNETGTAAPKTVTTSWQRFIVTQGFTAGSTGTATFVINNGTSAVIAWGAQLERQASAGVYVQTVVTDASANVNRGLVANGSVLFAATRTDLAGTVPVSGEGARFMWVPAKAAIRAGYVFGTEWNEANVGSRSVAFGSGNIASAPRSVAIGAFSTASGNSAVALGNTANATNTYAMAFGSSTASGIAAFAMGSSTASGDSSLAMAGSAASGLGAVAVGNNAAANGDYSVAIGQYVTAGTLAIQTDAMAIGQGILGNPLVNSTASSLAVGFNSNIPTLFVGPSAGVGTTGNVGIGDATPASLLTVGNGDRFNVNASGDVTSTFTTLDGSSTANGAGASSTTLILMSAANFNVGNYVQVASAACVANPCYAKITNVAVNTLTISPALSWSNADAVTEVHVPEVGGVDLTQTLANRYGRGYFIDGIVTGNGSTYLTDNKIESGGTFTINGVGNQPVTFGTGTVTMNGNLVVTGTVSGGGSGTFVNGGNAFGGAATLGTNDNFNLAFKTNNSTRMTVDTAGNVGIGTSGPVALLSVGSSSQFQVNSSGNITWPNAATVTTANVANALNVDANTLSIDALNNRVGIGNAAPAYPLDVTGEIRTTTNMRVNGSAVIGGNTIMNSATGGYFGATPSSGSAPAWQAFFDSNSVITSTQRLVLGIQTVTGNISNGFTTGAVLWSGTPTASSAAYDLYVGAHAHDGVTGADPSKMMTFKASNYRVGVHTASPANVFDVNGNMAVGAYAGVNSAPSNGLIVSGNVGIGTTAPNTALDVTGVFSVRGMAAPAVSPAGQGRIYFDSTANAFKVSENGGAYAALVAAAGVGGSGTAGQVPKFTAASMLGNSGFFENANGGGYGSGASVTGLNGFAIQAGSSGATAGASGFAVGDGAVATGFRSAAIGNGVSALGNDSYGFGKNIISGGTGHNDNLTIGVAFSALSKLTNTTEFSIMMGTSNPNPGLVLRGGTLNKSFTINTTAGSPIVTVPSSDITGYVMPGDKITVAGGACPANDTVVSVDSTTQMTLAQNCTAGPSAASFTVIPAFFRINDSSLSAVTSTAATRFVINSDGDAGFGGTNIDANAKVTVCADGNCTLPASAATAMVLASNDGTTTGSSIRAHGTITGGLADFGEYIGFEGLRSDYEQGDVVASSPTLDETVAKSSAGYQPNLMGVVTTTAGFVAGGGDESITYDDQGRPSNRVIIALVGRVPVKTTTENGTIERGDYLTSSATKPGYAMKAIGPGPVIGQALQTLDAGSAEGKVLVFIQTGWWNGTSVAHGNSSSQLSPPAALTIDQDVDLKGFALLDVRAIHGLGDAWSIDEFGRLTVNEAVMDSVRIRQRDGRATLDAATVAAGQDFVQIHNPAITPSTRVFVTMRKDPGSRWWVDEVGDGFAVVRIAQPASADVPFDYWLVQTLDERTPPAPPVPPTDPALAPAPDTAIPPAPDVPPAAPTETVVPSPDPAPAPDTSSVPAPTPAP